MKPTVRERLLSRLIIDHDTGCLLWAGARIPQGYGTITVNNRTQRVHRVAWELENGPIPPGLTIDHVYDLGCRHKHCANVAHLELVTTQENTRRAFERYVPTSECRRGHLRTAANTRFDRKGRIHCCRICERERDRERRQRAPSLASASGVGGAVP